MGKISPYDLDRQKIPLEVMPAIGQADPIALALFSRQGRPKNPAVVFDVYPGFINQIALDRGRGVLQDHLGLETFGR
jgi:hypothetical protein